MELKNNIIYGRNFTYIINHLIFFFGLHYDDEIQHASLKTCIYVHTRLTTNLIILLDILNLRINLHH